MKLRSRGVLYLVGALAGLGLSVGFVLTAGAQTPTGNPTAAAGSPTAAVGSPTVSATTPAGSPTAAVTTAAASPTAGAAGAQALPSSGTGTTDGSSNAVEYSVLIASVIGALALGGGLIASARRR